MISDSEKRALVNALARVVTDEVRAGVKAGLEPVQQELARLTLKLEHAELRVRELRYAGVWSDRGIYKKGNMTSHAGSLWHCNVDNIATVPGQDHDGWTLCVKSMART